MKLYLCLALMGSVLVGCQVAPPAPEPEPVIKTIIVLPPNKLLSRCVPSPPPDKKQYFNAAPEERADLLLDYSDQNLKSLGQCNRDWERLKNWKAETKNKFRFDPNVTILE